MGILLNSAPNRAQRRANAEVIHKTPLFGGRMNAQEAWARYAFPVGARCLGCSRPPTVSVTAFVPAEEMDGIDPLWKTWPEADKQKLTVQFDPNHDGIGTPYVRWREVFACANCRSRAGRAAAKLPSWVVVEIKAGPQADRLVVAPHSQPLTEDATAPDGGPLIVKGS